MKKKVIIALIAIVVAFILGIISIRTFVLPIKYKEQVLAYSEKYNIDPYLVLAVINTESRFDKEATSSKDAKGLMQVTDATAQEVNEITNSTEVLTEENIYDEDINIEIGCQYLASLIERYNGNYYLAICAYNAGIGNVNKWIEEEKVSATLDTIDIELPFSETTNYLKKVISNYKNYKIVYPNLSI
ncbi:MAG: lytic transglycosylase domain-containing protein [Clostridia bacterium]|nr:lytic transglycosylase domain-containing protein [Clostridia bacterium]